MNWKVDTKVYTLVLTESRSSYDRYDHINAIESVNNLQKTSPKKDGRLVDKQARAKITHFRRLLHADYPRIYTFSIFFKRYQYKTRFDVEYNPKLHKNWAKTLQSAIRDELGKYRREKLAVNSDSVLIFKEHEVKIAGSRWTKYGRIYSEPGQLYKIALKRKVKELFNPKLPTEKHKYVGLELEFCAKIEELDFALILWKAGLGKFTQMKKDGSLRPKADEHGYELALLLPEHSYRKYLRQVCKVLDAVGAKSEDRRCGLHVHLDMRRRKKDIVYNNLIACQNVFFSFLDPNRRDNEFCRQVQSRKFPTKFTNEREERYKTVNAASYYKYKTLEVRMHEGSINFKDICNWMDLLIKIANHKTRIKQDVNELTQLKKRIRIEPKMAEFFQDKVCFWQLQGPQRRTIPRAGAFASVEVALRLSDETTVATPSPARPG